MKRFLLSATIAAAVGFSVAAQAVPFDSIQTQDSLVVPVAGGCGAYYHRGPYGGCVRNGYYHAPVVVAPPVYYGGPAYYAPVGPCGGRGQHRVCGVNGCIMVCN
jgi:hypothetical protein